MKKRKEAKGAMTQRMTEDEISYEIIGAAIEVHKVLGGPGLLESVYEASLCYELIQRGFSVQRQLLVPVTYKNQIVRDPLCLDILVEEKVIVEVKATEKEHAIHQTQFLTYLRLKGLKLGLLINFGQPCVKDGVDRVVNGL